MKPFLGIDITTNRKNERLNGNEFLILKPSEMRQRPIESTGFPCRSISQRTLDFLASSYLRYSIRPINNL